jgi:hypothetical protein
VGILVAALIFTHRGLLPFAGVAIWAYAWIASVNFASGYKQVGATATVFAVTYPVVVLGSKFWWARKEALSHSSAAVCAKETS